MTISFKKITKPTNLFYFQHIIANPKLMVFLWLSQSCTTSRPSVSMHVSPQNAHFVFIFPREIRVADSSSAAGLIYCVTVKAAPSLSHGSHSLLPFG